jgi:mRNA-degrading endonuclease toxin of MazEF toxin-antitoxin module
MESATGAVQRTLDEDLVTRVDRAARQLGTSRSAFRRDASRAVLDPCAINPEHVQTVPKERLGGSVATLRASTMRDVARAPAFELDLTR